MRRWVLIAGKALLLVGSLVVAALVLDGVCGVLNRLAPPRPLLENVAGGPMQGHEQFNQYHPLLGMDGIPNLRTRAPSGKLVTHNSRGNRSPEVATAKPPGVRRVVLLGDSNTWGYGLADDETVGAQLAGVLAAGPGRWEVINLGVTGYGTDQEYLKLLVQGVEYAPDWVVVVYFHLNDMPDSLATLAYGVEKPRFWLRDGRLCLGNVPPAVALGWPNHQVSRIVEQYRPAAGWHVFGVDLAETEVGRFVRGRQWRPWVVDAYGKRSATTFAWLTLDPGRARILQEHLSCPGPEVPVTDGLSLVVALMRRMQEVTTDVGGRFLIASTPPAGDYKAGHPHEQYTRALHTFTTADLPALDMFALAQAKGVAPADLYQQHAGDDHFTVLGQRLMAEAIASYVLGQQ